MKLSRVLAVAAICAVTTTAVAAKPTKGGGMFYIKNKSSKTVVVGVGNYFPSKYTIAPGSSKLVVVSTNNQDIQIEAVK